MELPTQKTLTFHVRGMHCNACIVMTENALMEVSYVSFAKSSLQYHRVEITGVFPDKHESEIAKELSQVLEKHGYSLSTQRQIHDARWSEFKIAAPLAFSVIALFVVLQKIGIVNFVTTDSVSLGMAFVIGIIASLSTCMAVVGGLLLSLSATFAKDGYPMKPHILFHVGRLVSFFVLGGVIGMVGSAFQLNAVATFIVSLIIALAMLTLGINLLDIFPWAKKLQPSMPRLFSRYVFSASRMNHILMPLLVGVATFFLPCGFTQSMQLFTLSTGSFVYGGVTMFIFALGTLPVLSLISFSSLSIQQNSKSGIFFKTAGLVVIMFATFNLINSFVAIGLMPPVFNL